MDGADDRQEEPPAPEPEPADSRLLKPIRRGAGTWFGALFLLLVVTATLIFTVQNLKPVPVHLVGVVFRLPLGVAILFGGVFGALVMFVVGSILLIRQGGKRG